MEIRYSIDDLINLVFDEAKVRFSFMNISDVLLLEKIKEFVVLIKGTTLKDAANELFYNVENYYYNEIGKKIKFKDYSFIDRYIKNNFEVKDTVNENVLVISEVVQFLGSVDVSLNDESILNYLISNKILNACLKKIFDSKEVSRNYLDSLTFSLEVLNLFEAYCLSNDIKIRDDNNLAVCNVFEDIKYCNDNLSLYLNSFICIPRLKEQE